MYVKTLSIAVAALLNIVTAAPPQVNYANNYANIYANAFSQLPSISISSRCYTAMDSTSVPWAQSTSWSTHFTPCTTTSTLTKTVTTPPPSVTKTVTSTVTTVSTASTITNTATVSTTLTLTTNTTSISTTIVTTSANTTSTVSVTSTVPTSAGFLPIQSTEPGATYDGSDGGSLASKRAVNAASNLGSLGRSLKRFPQGVKCFQYPVVACLVVTKTATQTVQGSSTGTVTSTATATLTSTIVPYANTTTTITALATSTSTIISVTTSTVTTTPVVSTTTSIYAACATNNFANQLNGKTIINASPANGQSDVNIISTDASTAYDCCEAVFAYTGGTGEVWAQVPGTTECDFGYASNTCSAQSYSQWELTTGSSSYTYGNANCGEINS